MDRHQQSHDPHPQQQHAHHIPSLYESAFLPFSTDPMSMASIHAIRPPPNTANNMAWTTALPPDVTNMLQQNAANTFPLHEDLELELPTFTLQHIDNQHNVRKTIQKRTTKQTNNPTKSNVPAETVPPIESLKAKRKMRKNNREKQRRSEINEKFEELADVLNIKQKNKAEKHTILSEAINLINALRSENNELRTDKQELRAELARLTNTLQQAFPMESSIQVPQIDTSRSSISLQEAASYILEHANSLSRPGDNAVSTKSSERQGDIMQGGEAMMRLASYAQLMQAPPETASKLSITNLGDGMTLAASESQAAKSLSNKGARGAFTLSKANTLSAANEDLDLFSS